MLNMNNSMRESVGMTSDVTEDVIERRRPDDAMRWNEERYRTLFDLGPVAVYSCDAAGVIRNTTTARWSCGVASQQ